MIKSRFKLSAEGPPFSGTTRVLSVDVAPARADAVVEALDALVGALPDHPALIPFTDAGVGANGHPFLITPTLTGEPLDAALSVYGPAAMADALPRLQQLADALDVAAAHGLCHGALTPHDIYVSAEESAIVGVGVANALRSAGYALPLTEAYAAPEVLSEGEASARGDQYALAVIAYEWLFGRRFTPAAGDFGSALPGIDTGQLRTAFATATSSNAAERFDSCTAFVASLSLASQTQGSRFQASRVLEFQGAVGELPLNDDSEPEAPATEVRAPESRYATLAAALMVGVALGAAGMWLMNRRPQATAVPQPMGIQNAAQVDATANTTEVSEPSINPARDDISPSPRAAALAPTPIAAASDAAPASQFDAGLLVHSAPAGSLVTVDGTPRGTTPVAVRGLEFGNRRVVVSRPGYRVVERQVALTPERPSRTLEIELQPLPRPAASGSTAAVTGSLIVDSRPSGAIVTIDGRRAGTTPLMLSAIAPGTHTVKLERTGYRAVTTSVDVKAGERARVAARLEGGPNE